MEKKVFNVGLIGAGRGIGLLHAKAVFETKGAKLLWVCDPDNEATAKVAADYDVPNTTADYKEVLADDTVDAVIIATPDQLHREMIQDSLAAGKHILCEKPLALTREDIEAIVSAVKKSDKIFMVGQLCRYTPGFVEAKKVVDSGAIGERTFIESEYAHDYAHIGGAGGWRVTPERHAIIGGGCHAVDLLRRIAGNPEEVFAYANHKVLKNWPVDDCTVAVMKFPNNVIGKVMCSIGCKRKYTMRTVLYGSKGTLVIDSKQAYITLYRDRFTEEPYLKDRWQQEIGMDIPIAVNDHNFCGEVTDFANAVIEGKLVDCTGEEGMVTVATCLAIVESAAKEEKVKISYDL